MLKVSLLPESYRKKVVGSKRKEQIKKMSLVVLVMLFVFFVAVISTRFYVSSKYDDIQRKNMDAKAMFPVLESYQELYNGIKAQRELINAISPKKPYAHSFLVNLSNIEQPGLWLTKTSTDDWHYNKLCVVEGSCLEYNTVLSYIEKIKDIDGVLEVELSSFTYTDERAGTEDRICSFTIAITCEGAATPYEVVETSKATTTTEDENAGVS